jgi:chromosome segregation ATPase
MDKVLEYFKKAIQERIDELTREQGKAANEMAAAQLVLKKAKEDKDDIEATLRNVSARFESAFMEVQNAQSKVLNIEGSITEMLNLKNINAIEVEN